MLLELRISGLAIIDEIKLDLSASFQVFTGETGAGKSIIMDSLSLLMGSKGTPELIKSNHTKCVINGVFDISSLDSIHEALREEGLPDEDYLVLERALFKDGKSRAWVNGKAVGLNTLRLLGSKIIDFHGQGEQQLLLNSDHQRELLDKFCGSTTLKLKEEVESIFLKDKILIKELMSLKEEERRVGELVNLWEYQLEELQKANLNESEEDELKSEKIRLSHAEELGRLVSSLKEILYEGESGISLNYLSSEVERDLKILSSIDNSLSCWTEDLSNYNLKIRELGRFLTNYLGRLEYNPQRLEEIEQRLEIIDDLKRKHKKDVSGLILLADELIGKLNRNEDLTIQIKKIEKELYDTRNILQEKAISLSEYRREGANTLGKKVEEELKNLNMSETIFYIKIEPLKEVGPHGLDETEFLMAPFINEELKPLRFTASGGELSRIMLALKSVLKGVDRTPVLVFDEVDAGIGGKTAEVVGAKLKELGEHHQIFLVTHLSQLAAQADNHYLVEKKYKPEGIGISVTSLEGEERVIELARMLVGGRVTETTLQQARELLGENVFDTGC